MAGEAAWGVALHGEAVIRPLAEQPRLSAESIAEAANELGLSRSILYKLLQRYRRRPQTSSLLPWKRGRKPDEPLLSDEREALLNACIDEFYLQPERRSLAALYLEVRRRFAERTLDLGVTGTRSSSRGSASCTNSGRSRLRKCKPFLRRTGQLSPQVHWLRRSRRMSSQPLSESRAATSA